MAREAKNGRILFVEDENSISEPFAEALKRAGFDAVVARPRPRPLISPSGSSPISSYSTFGCQTAMGATSVASCGDAPMSRS